MYRQKCVSDVFLRARSRARAGTPALGARCTRTSAATLYAVVNVPVSVAMSCIVALGAFSLVTPGRLSDVVAAVAALMAMLLAASHTKETSA
jgi:hypothetical protein